MVLVDNNQRTIIDSHCSVDVSTMNNIPPLTHVRLRRFVVDDFDLARFGIGRGDRVAVFMPNGPELALAIVA